MEQSLPPVVIAIPLVLVAVAVVWLFLKEAKKADDMEALFEALRGAGFMIERDAREWLKSRMPRLDIRNVFVSQSRRSRGQILEESVAVKLAHREDAQAHVIAVVLPESIRRTHDRFVVGIDPKNRAVLTLPPEEQIAAIQQETGWSCEAHGVWLLLYRTEPLPTAPGDASRVVDEALGVSFRILGAGVR